MHANHRAWRKSAGGASHGSGVFPIARHVRACLPQGMAAVRLLRELESRTGRRIHELFDLVVGTSTGGLLACALALRGFSLDQCEAMYKVLGAKVFSRAAPEEGESGWVDSFVRSFHSRTQHVRAVVVGFMHDTGARGEHGARGVGVCFFLGALDWKKGKLRPRPGMAFV